VQEIGHKKLLTLYLDSTYALQYDFIGLDYYLIFLYVVKGFKHIYIATGCSNEKRSQMPYDSKINLFDVKFITTADRMKRERSDCKQTLNYHMCNYD
jgi:hypothetical protein